MRVKKNTSKSFTFEGVFFVCVEISSNRFLRLSTDKPRLETECARVRIGNHGMPINGFVSHMVPVFYKSDGVSFSMESTANKVPECVLA